MTFFRGYIVKILTYLLICLFFASFIAVAQEEPTKEPAEETTAEEPAEEPAEETTAEEPAEETTAEEPAEETTKEPTTTKPFRPFRDRVKKFKEAALAKMSEAQKANFKKLNATIQGIKAKSLVTPEQKAKLKADIIKCLNGVHKPDPATIKKLAADIVKACATGAITPANVMTVIQDVQAVLMSANISQENAEAITQDIQEILKASKLTKADGQAILADIKKIIETARANAPRKTGKPLLPRNRGGR